MACAAGIICDPGKSAVRRMASSGIRARNGTNRNRPPNWVRNCRGERSSARTSATAATAVRGPAGRSSSDRRGNLAKPSSFSTRETATGLRGVPSSAKTRLMS